MLFDNDKLNWWRWAADELEDPERIVLVAARDYKTESLTVDDVVDLCQELIELRAECRRLIEESAPEGFRAEFDSYSTFQGYYRNR